MKNLEQELKMSLSEREYNILLGVAGVKPQLQINYYFRSKDMPFGTMVRLRAKGKTYQLCYKQLLSDRSGIAVCDERECEVSADYANSMRERGITVAEARDLLGVEFNSELTYVGSLSTYRALFNIEEWTVELDKNEYLDTVDYELECENLFVEQLEKLKNFLFYTYGIVFRQSKPKVQRFWEKYNQ